MYSCIPTLGNKYVALILLCQKLKVTAASEEVA
jgi:hypothetical protein